MSKINTKLAGQSDYAVPPGETLAELLEYFEMSQKDLSVRLGVSQKTISEIINGKAPISPATALGLGDVFEPDPSYWLALEANYQADLIRIAAKKQVRAEVVQFADYIEPYNEMARLGWVPRTRNAEEKVINLRKYCRVSSLAYIPNLPSAANFRKGNIGKQSLFALTAWMQKGEDIAAEIKTKPFSSQRLKDVVPKLRQVTFQGKDIGHEIRDLCASAGVAITFAPPLKGTHVNGATRWLTPEKANIHLSLLGAYADIFWFTLFHEIGHILLGHSKKTSSVSCYNGSTPVVVIGSREDEDAADKFANDTLIPEKEYVDFIRYTARFNDGAVDKFAKSVGIYSGIVWGRLAHEGKINWTQATANGRRKKLQFA